MNFLLPLGLLALLTLPVIVILHLIRERRRRVMVPSLLHWLAVPRKQEAQRVQRLPLTLLLLLHLLIAALLGLALARPQLVGLLSGQARQTAIVLDTSTSMAAQSGLGTRFDEARERARQLLRGLSAGDRVTLIAAGPTPRVLAAGVPGGQAELEAALGALQPGGTGSDLEGALVLAEAALDPQMSGRIVVLTDGGATPPQPRAFAAPVEWQQVGGGQPNRAIVAFAARPTGGALQVYARIGNYAPGQFTTVLRLFADEQPLDTRNIIIEADGETELTWRLPSGTRTLRAEVDGDDGLPQDDTALLNVATTRPVAVQLVSDTPDALRRALSAVPGVQVAVVAPASYAPDGTADLTVFEGYLPPAWPASAVLVVNPPPGSQLLEVSGAPRLIEPQNLTQRGALLAGLSFGGVYFDSAQVLAPPDWARVLLAEGDTPLILRGQLDERELAIWTFSLADSNLPTRLAFPLLTARTVRDLTAGPLPQALLAGETLLLRPSPRASEVELVGPDGASAGQEAAPALQFDALTQPGWYRVVERGALGAVFEGQVPVNAGAALEANLQPQPAPELHNAAATTDDPAQRRATDLWPWLALAALAVLALEWGYFLR